MSISILKPFNILISTITSTAISVVGAFAIFDINNKAEALVTSGDPNDYIVNPGTGYDGVVNLLLKAGSESYGCSGSLLSSGRHILTAAHCLTDEFGFNVTTSATALFDLDLGKIGIKTKNIFIAQDWGGFADFDSFGNDLAILELESVAPEAAERYNIYRNKDEIGQVGVKVGYGLSGQGNNGFDPVNFPFGVKRFGQNLYEAGGEILTLLEPTNVVPGAFLAYDFDNGKPENDALASLGIPDLGLGLQEVTAAPGDSGGPTFINGLIAGITSGGICVSFDNFECTSPPDVDTILNASFGEFGFDTRVSTYASYIDDVLAGKVTPTKTVPEPNPIFGTILALGTFAIHSRFKKSKHQTTTKTS